MRQVLNRIIVTVMIVGGAPALAAAQTEKGNLAVGFATLRNPEFLFRACWVFAATRNLDPTFSLVGEADGGYATKRTSAGDVNVHTHSVLAGLRLQAPAAPGISGFAQALIGGTFLGASGADSWSDQAFTVQPGVGFDIRITPSAGVRIQADARSHSAGGGEGFVEFRLGMGVIFDFGR